MNIAEIFAVAYVEKQARELGIESTDDEYAVFDRLNKVGQIAKNLLNVPHQLLTSHIFKHLQTVLRHSLS